MLKVALVVDDSMLFRYTVCCFLEKHGFAVESATNGEEALEVLARVRPALIVTDMGMPRMSGSELITAVKFPIALAAGYAKAPNLASRFALVGHDGCAEREDSGRIVGGRIVVGERTA